MTRFADPWNRGARLGRLALACAALAAGGGLPGDACAQNAPAGKSLYKTYCQVCHSVDPSSAVAPFNLIMTAANNPAQITAAAAADPAQMGFIPDTLTSANLQDIAAYLGTFLGATVTINVVEFYQPSRDHYFMSASAAEIVDLDTGVHPGWVRTGLSFKGYPAAVGGASSVCRFYIPPANGDSHFYSASPTECAQVQAKFPAFSYESPNVFYIGLPDIVSGACAAGTVPVYRVWDDRADTNHRYTTSTAIRQQMLAMGWLAEGYGPNQVIMCAPQ
ncbi:MAG: cytochrome c [Betaproteobacteria bacterium]